MKGHETRTEGRPQKREDRSGGAKNQMEEGTKGKQTTKIHGNKDGWRKWVKGRLSIGLGVGFGSEGSVQGA